MADDDPMIGRVLSGTIEIRRKIGAGGMGSVYEGFQEHLDRAVAVKVMNPEHARNPIAAQYFLREARATSKLRHPNVIQIFDYGSEDDDTIFIAMEFVPGRPLSELIRSEFPLDPARVISLLDQTLSGLAQAHRKQLIHRDLKPDNLMVERIDRADFVKILDFGIAQVQGPDEKAGPLTQAGAVVGTPQYMSPEQATSSGVDGRSDLFSLGIILYEMLTQTAPFKGRSLPEILIAVMKHHPQPPSAVRPDLSIDPGLEAVCLRAMKKEPDLRFQTADEFRRALVDLGDLKAPVMAAPSQFVFRRSRKAQTKGVEAAAPPRGHADPDVPGTLVEFADAASDAVQDFSLEDIADDLLSERAIVTALVLHQRSHARIDPESMAEVRASLDNAIAASAAQWDARLLGRQGSFVTLIFGVPTPTPDDSFRAVQAALSLRRALSEIVPDGTAFGYALAFGEVYCPSGQVDQAAGEPLDEATEAARVAGDDNVVVTGDSLAVRLGTMFRLGALDDEGHQAVLGVLDVGRKAPRVEARDHVELVGRDAEIAALLGAFGRLGKSRGTVMAVTGEAGVGKTAIVSEIVRVAEQRATLTLMARWTGEGAEALRDARLQWLMELLRHRGYLPRDAHTAFRELGLEAEYSRLLAAFIVDRLEEAFGFVGKVRRTAQSRLRADEAISIAMLRLWRVVCEEQRIVMVLDQVQGTSDALSELLASWSSICKELPILLVVAARTQHGLLAGLEGPTDEMRLEPLAEAPSIAFLKVRLPSTVPGNVVTRLARIGAGYPAHLEHLARLATTRGFDIEHADEELAKSNDIAELLRLRAYREPKDHQNVLAVLSGLGDGVRAESLIDLCKASWKPDDAVRLLVEGGLLEASGDAARPRLHFRPPALRHVVYDRLSRKMRGQIHERAARYFEERVRAARDEPERADVLELARHRERSGDVEGAIEVIKGLAERAFRANEYGMAADALQRGIALMKEHRADDVERIGRLELQFLRAEAAIGKRQLALDRCRRLSTREGLGHALRNEVRLELARLWLVDEDPELVGNIVRSALTEVRKLQAASPDDIELRCLLIVALQVSAEVHAKQNRLVQAAEFAVEAAGLVERGEVDPLNNPWGPEIVWETLNIAARVRLRLGETDLARRVLVLARRLVDKCDDPRGKVAVGTTMSAVFAEDGDLERAYKELSDALRIARELGDPQTLARLEHNRGLVLRRQRRLEMALEAFEDSLALAEDLDWRDGIATNTAQIDWLRGRLEQEKSRR